jgi:UDP-3-O-[3-hydroxymyristoyl] glucosamine N-acyltransferase
MFEQKTFSLARLAAALELEFQGEPEFDLNGIAPLATAKANQLSFLSKSKYRVELASSSAGTIILHPDHAADFAGNCLLSLNPYLSYVKASALFDPLQRPRAALHPSAVVVAEDIHDSLVVGANWVMEGGAEIGEGSVIVAGVVIGENSKIGKHCNIHPNVSI